MSEDFDSTKTYKAFLEFPFRNHGYGVDEQEVLLLSLGYFKPEDAPSFDDPNLRLTLIYTGYIYRIRAIISQYSTNSTNKDVFRVIISDTIECPICGLDCETPENPEEVHILYCGHVFGSQCIDSWLETSFHSNCPTCRKPQIHPGCSHICLSHPLNDHPTIPGAEADRIIERICIVCHLNTFNEDDIAFIVGKDPIWIQGRSNWKADVGRLDQLALDLNLPAVGQQTVDRFKQIYNDLFLAAAKRWHDKLRAERW